MGKINIVISTGHRSWAIGKLAKNLSTLITEFDTRIIEMPQSRRHARSLKGWKYFPKADISLFMQQDLLLKAMQSNWIRNTDYILVRYTHNNRPLGRYQEALLLCKKIYVENTQMKKEIIKLGINGDKVTFKPHPIEWQAFNKMKTATKSRDVIFVSNFYKRKRPDLILQAIKSLPDITFTIFGKNWERWSEFPKLAMFKNLEYVNFNYEKYPHVLAQHKVFCSLSDIEGGPVPLLESLTAGLAVVATNTGYSQDMSKLTDKIIVLPVSPDVTLVSESLQKALLFETVNINTKEFDLESYVDEITNVARSCTA